MTQNEEENKDKPESSGIKRTKEGKFVPGTSGNPAGKPKGTLSIKGRIKQLFKEDKDLFEQFTNKMIKEKPDLVWQMLEGRPTQDITSDDKPLPQPIYGGVIEKEDKDE